MSEPDETRERRLRRIPVHASAGLAEQVLSVAQARPRREGVWDVRERLQENFQRVESLLRDMEASDDPAMRLSVAAELRQHIALAEKTLEQAARAEAVQAFEQTVLDALDRASTTVRRKVIDILNARADSAGVLRPPE